MILHRLALAALVVLMAACRGGRPFALRDTEGWEYTVHCPESGCAHVMESPHPSHLSCAPGEQAGFALEGRGVIAACHACVRGDRARVFDPSDCRALVCDADPDCPPRVDGERIRCVHGVCQGGASELDAIGATALCMAGAGAAGHESAGERTERVAITRRSCPADNTCAANTACRAR